MLPTLPGCNIRAREVAGISAVTASRARVFVTQGTPFGEILALSIGEC
jgi:hypothetical protein